MKIKEIKAAEINITPTPKTKPRSLPAARPPRFTKPNGTLSRLQDTTVVLRSKLEPSGLRNHCGRWHLWGWCDHQWGTGSKGH